MSTTSISVAAPQVRASAADKVDRYQGVRQYSLAHMALVLTFVL
jgi:hypothetical protein